MRPPGKDIKGIGIMSDIILCLYRKCDPLPSDFRSERLPSLNPSPSEFCQPWKNFVTPARTNLGQSKSRNGLLDLGLQPSEIYGRGRIARCSRRNMDLAFLLKFFA